MKKNLRKERRRRRTENEKQKKIIKLLIYDFSSFFLLENSPRCVTVVGKIKMFSMCFILFVWEITAQMRIFNFMDRIIFGEVNDCTFRAVFYQPDFWNFWELFSQNPLIKFKDIQLNGVINQPFTTMLTIPYVSKKTHLQLFTEKFRS